MKKVLCVLLGLQVLSLYLFSQSNGKISSLPVYRVADKDLAVIIDSFIVAAKNCTLYPSVDFFLYVSLYKDTSLVRLILDLRKKEDSLEAKILYDNPNCRQILVCHNDCLLETTICEYPDFDRVSKLPDGLFKKTRKKQKVLYKEPPLDYFDANPVKGEVEYESQIFGWYYYYENNHWNMTMRVYYNGKDE